MMTYEKAIDCAKYAAVETMISGKNGNAEEYMERYHELHGMAKMIATIFDKWEETDEGQSYGAVFYDILKAANGYFGK